MPIPSRDNSSAIHNRRGPRRLTINCDATGHSPNSRLDRISLSRKAVLPIMNSTSPQLHVLLGALFPSLASRESAAADRPNIVFILADDR
jgi:hypothetical protein